MEEDANVVDQNGDSPERRVDTPPTSVTQHSADVTASGLSGFFRKYIPIEWMVSVLYQPTDPSSLAVSRILFGLLMFFDIPEERGLSEADIRWGDPDECRFPLFDFLEPLPLHWMCFIYLIMWLGALGIALGAYFKLSCLAFAVPYWYIFVLDKTAWNNHSYLFGILAILFFASDAHFYWSVDSWQRISPKNMDIPAINYIMLRFQMFLLYFHAGIKKTESDWISGHSMTNLAKHWVFKPFTLFLSTKEIDLYIVHGCGFFLDLTVGFLIFFDKTRPASFFFLILFHLMNSQMFYIGMFPFVCLATMPLFCQYNWPKLLLSNCKKLKHLISDETIRNPECIYSDEEEKTMPMKKKWAVYTFLTYAAIQLFLPYSHFITKGYNNWTNGLYGYSWDMMVHTWDVNLATVRIHNHKRNESFFIDPEAWVKNDKWQRHADMVVQYSQCLKRNLERKDKLKDISIYIDIWASLNNRFHQRMYDPNVDILQANWSPFCKTEWLLPLLENLTHWRPFISSTEDNVRSWSEAADIMFLADFPGLSFPNYIHTGVSNVTLNVLEGKVAVEIEDEESRILPLESTMKLPSGKFHLIRTISSTPSAFMYTYFNNSKLYKPKEDNPDEFKFSLYENFLEKVNNFLTSIALVSNGFLTVLYSIPMTRRVRLPDDDDHREL